MRLELTKRSELALRLMQVLDDSAERLRAQDLAELTGSSAGFVPQVLAPLVSRGWIESQPGPTGGYELETSLEDVSLLALIEALEGPTDTGRCVLVEGPCAVDQACALHDPWMRARDALVGELAATPLSAIPRKPIRLGKAPS